MNTTKTSVAVAKGATEAKDLEIAEQGAGAAIVLCLLGLVPGFYVGMGEWVKATWPVGVPAAAVAVFASKDAKEKREAIEQNFFLEQNKDQA